jgi:hypothetical protein
MMTESRELRRTGSAVRLNWLEEVADALDEAHRLCGLLGAQAGRAPEAIALRGRIRPVLAEVEALRVAAAAGFAPRWSYFG